MNENSCRTYKVTHHRLSRYLFLLLMAGAIEIYSGLVRFQELDIGQLNICPFEIKLWPHIIFFVSIPYICLLIMRSGFNLVIHRHFWNDFLNLTERAFWLLDIDFKLFPCVSPFLLMSFCSQLETNLFKLLILRRLLFCLSGLVLIDVDLITAWFWYISDFCIVPFNTYIHACTQRLLKNALPILTLVKLRHHTL